MGATLVTAKEVIQGKRVKAEIEAMANLSLYTTTAFLLLDNDGDRVMAKYYEPPHAASAPAPANAAVASLNGPPQLTAKNPFGTVKEQKAFERALWEKTRKSTGDILLYDSHLVLMRNSLDVTFYVVGPADENPMMLSGLLAAIVDSITLLLRGQVEKRAILENLDLVTLAVDECVDDGIILETDAAAIASRVSRPRPDVTELQINEQTIMNAYSTLRDRVAQRILQGSG